ncbi:MAG: tRNA (uridine(34)/cytosine(34)/5-carboxymethylaminomethyluridine(34)-2'-O)-methyltransferase TrmL [Spirochaetes bacterium]|nr:MAG: tRNA (uridine(34)/cytosine(34)/5-carboxymethylaminomethyluridine(34)-2'-O)-methyltransferase TrmL [Spirochaetota bacterium]RKX81856.1 MAG: tRNA (uridine(34)/cytosine(34)/5-carboxymethylaminomethyluridine(34)-2'-O)-methyltransferase TrmL [Spirochaetota bacterium]RKX96974.1 MAG: tRNA (uridine(34)/cytosine(34)/5-carboxymethylaminomethyluridine(34)-2'-O)-methyltransferase TrmL [Spirochaetota bacterium]
MELHIVLLEPEIPQNTGSIGRTCMAIAARLHLIKPLGFSLEDKYLKRAGLDYWKDLDVEIHESWYAFTTAYPDAPLWYFTTKASRRHDEVKYGERVFLVFGKETAGIPDMLLKKAVENCVRIPLLERARSLNLSVAVGVAAFEALRQGRFAGLSESDPEGRLFNNLPEFP